MPMGRTMVYIHGSNTHSGTWTEYDTKVCIAITIVSLIVSLLAILIEAMIYSRGSSFKKSFVDIMEYPVDTSLFTFMSIGFSLVILAVWIVVGLVFTTLSFM